MFGPQSHGAPRDSSARGAGRCTGGFVLLQLTAYAYWQSRKRMPIELFRRYSPNPVINST